MSDVRISRLPCGIHVRKLFKCFTIVLYDLYNRVERERKILVTDNFKCGLIGHDMQLPIHWLKSDAFTSFQLRFQLRTLGNTLDNLVQFKTPSRARYARRKVVRILLPLRTRYRILRVKLSLGLAVRVQVF